MLSRRYAARSYGVDAPGRVLANGAMRTGSINGFDQAWPIVRPANSPSPRGAPQYLIPSNPGAYPQAQHNRRALPGGGVGLSLRTNTNTALNRRSGG